MAADSPPSEAVIWFTRFWEDAAGLAPVHARTTSDAYRLQWRAIREILRRDGNLKGVTL